MINEPHGADIYTAAKKSGIEKDKIIDFSSNINPLGMPDSVKEAAINSIYSSHKYPDINSRELICGISKAEGVPAEWIFPSNGAAEAIYRIVQYLKSLKSSACFNGLVTAPSFSEYENALKASGAKVVYYNLMEEQNFEISDGIKDCINREIKIVFLCNPNNPTGQLTDKETMEGIIRHCKYTGTIAVIDECFLDFTENKQELSSVNLLGKYDNLVVLKAFTKIYAMPGIRLGYCMCSDKGLIGGLKSSGPPWNVSSIAQCAGIAALDEKEYVAKSIVYVKEQRNYLKEELKKLNVKVYDSYANYILFRLRENIDLKEELLKRYILIRSCSNYKNLDESYYRIAVRTERENQLFIKAMKELQAANKKVM